MIIGRIPVEKQEIEYEIELLRNELFQCVKENGLTCNRTMKVSKELDKSILKYQLLSKFNSNN